MTGIRELRWTRVVRPLRTSFSTSLGTKERLFSVLVQAVLEDGRYGLGEIPTSFTYPEQGARLITRVLHEARRRLKGVPVEAYDRYVASLRRDLSGAPMAVSGVETALFRAFLAASGVSEHTWWGGRSNAVETDVTIPIPANKEALRRWIGRTVRLGFRTFKLKVRGDCDEDSGLLSLVSGELTRAGAMASGVRLRLDGNQGYKAEEFLRFVDYLGKRQCEIELFEQPCRRDDYQGLAYVTGRSPIPIVLDETVQGPDDARRAIDHNLCHGINIKIAKSGIAGSAEILRLTREHGLKAMIGCMTETMGGLSAAVFMATGTGSFDFVDLDSVYLLYGKNSYPGIDMQGPLLLTRTGG